MAITVYPAPAAGKVEKTAIITSTQAWVAPADVASVDVLLVGGGGGGGGAATSGSQCGGGGGGGGVIQVSLAVTPSTSYTVTIGAGGAAGTNSGSAVAGSMGSNSTFGTLAQAYGGGGGNSQATLPSGTIAASSGGGSTANSTGAGSGGGAGTWAIALSATNYPGTYGVAQGYFGILNGNSGSGNPGVDGYGAGGGGGQQTTSNVLNRSGGINAGNGATAYPTGVNATASTANCGGGGGGGAYNGSPTQNGLASAGGSGICIIKYWSAL